MGRQKLFLEGHTLRALVKDYVKCWEVCVAVLNCVYFYNFRNFFKNTNHDSLRDDVKFSSLSSDVLLLHE